jgi:hypothetical protein
MSLLDKVAINPDFITFTSCIGATFETGVSWKEATIVGYDSTGE